MLKWHMERMRYERTVYAKSYTTSEKLLEERSHEKENTRTSEQTSTQ